MCENLRKIALYALIKSAARNQRADVSFFWRSCFFRQIGDIWQVWWKFGQKLCLKCFDLKKMRRKWNAVIFEVILFYFFSGKFREIWVKSLAPPKICLLLHLWKAMGFEGLHWMQKVGSGKASFATRVV